jgi:hypothetical protein
VLKPGTYTVTFSGASIATSTKTATVGTKNVKLDLMDPVLKSSTLAATALADDPSGDTAPAQTAPSTRPDTTDAVDSGNAAGKPANAWLADFFKMLESSGADQGTRAASKVAGAEDSAGKNTVALNGDQLAFDAKVAARTNVELADDLAGAGQIRQAAEDAVAALQAHLPTDVTADAGDAAQAAVAKILAQLAAFEPS